MTFVQKWHRKTTYPTSQFLNWLTIHPSKYYDWVKRAGQENQHGTMIPKKHWLTESEKKEILAYYQQHPQTGYRRLSYMMLDDGVVAVSPSSVYRTLVQGGLMRQTEKVASAKGTGFNQPQTAHEHWHMDITYINICGTFYYMCSILDGYSRFIVHWEIRPCMREPDVETILQRAREKFPEAKPRIITDNGPQFVASDFKNFIRLCGMKHVRTSPYYPQSNGKIERWHKTLKELCIRPGTPLSLTDAQRVVSIFVLHYNQHRLHSAIGYITPIDKLNGRESAIFQCRKEKLGAARRDRHLYWQQSGETLLQ